MAFEEVFTRLARFMDFGAHTRSQWRGICFGEERPVVQVFLLGLAEGAKAGASADRLALYKAAHAVMPLKDRELIKLAQLLVEYPPVPLEWCDVLVRVSTLEGFDAGDPALAAGVEHELAKAIEPARAAYGWESRKATALERQWRGWRRMK